MFDIPVNYGDKMTYNAQIIPSTVHCRDNKLQAYFRKYLFEKIISVYKWTIPETWDKDYFLYSLYAFGYVAVINTDKFGVIPQFGSLGGYNVFYRPTYVIITNPLLQTIKANIGTDCEIIKLQPDYSSVMDIVNYYADLMALCSQSVSINLINTHTATIFPASNKAQAESYKKMIDKISVGEPAVIMDKNLFDETGKPLWTPYESNVSNLYISDKILSDMRKIEAEFDTEIGIPNANTDKRERLITDEVNANNAETALRANMWLEELKAGCGKVNSMFDIGIKVDWTINPMRGDDINGYVDGNGTL